MKKSFLFLFVLLSTLGFSQGLRILQDSTDVTGKIIVQKIAPKGEYATQLSIFNSTSDKKEFIVTRLLDHKLDADYKLLFGLEKMIFVASGDPVQAPLLTFKINPHAYFRPGLEYGLTSFLYTGAVCSDHVVSYVLTDTVHHDSAFVTIQYTCATAVKEQEAEVVSMAYPNPATSALTIEYAFGTIPKNAAIVIHDLLGKTAKEISIDNKIAGKVSINVDELQSGSYFYTFILDGKPTVASKLSIINQ